MQRITTRRHGETLVAALVSRGIPKGELLARGWADLPECATRAANLLLDATGWTPGSPE